MQPLWNWKVCGDVPQVQPFTFLVLFPPSQAMLWETSLLDAEEGIRFRGHSIPELQVGGKGCRGVALGGEKRKWVRETRQVVLVGLWDHSYRPSCMSEVGA
jgi:hypothetical protein